MSKVLRKETRNLEYRADQRFYWPPTQRAQVNRKVLTEASKRWDLAVSSVNISGGIYRPAIFVHFEVDMRTGRATTGTH